MEFLSHEFNYLNKTFPVNLVIQSRESDRAGFDAHGTNTFQTVNLDFDPTVAFHEYRFDYLPGKVKFYADSKLLCEMTGSAIPSSAGHLILQHWSNGNALWSGGPPAEDASIVVSYVKAYYNSSKTSTDLFVECDGSMDRACIVPNMSALNASTGGPYLTLGEPHIGDASAANILMSAGVAQYLVIAWLITWLRVACE
ncbi:hypothetical protein VHEMI01494 [[Torrubiella] hemipterigena]|uniref:GH16 domain-containing protein n=1 Tax=[Torrubiella] hemipterigena TaxID=1531966 RepID=A0A0A1SM24_9HYPO|nr:hypothetical protein VHEMI01494 [[Torrubiella] hemipterigena]